MADEQALNEAHRGLYVTSSTLTLAPLQPGHFASDGTLNVACLGKIEAKFWESDSAVNSFNNGRSHQQQHQQQQLRVLKVMESQWPGKRGRKGSFCPVVGKQRCLFLLMGRGDRLTSCGGWLVSWAC